MTPKDTVVKYWTDDVNGELWYQTNRGYCGKWNDPGWSRLPLPPGCIEDLTYMEWQLEEKKKLKSLQKLLAEHREKQYYCRTPADETLWKETLETLFEEETK